MRIKEAITTHIRNELILNGKKLKGEEGCDDIEFKGDLVIIKSDSKHFNDLVVNNIYNAGECRRKSDYVIVSESVILICELKTKNTSSKRKQLLNTRAFIEYVLRVLEGIVLVKPPPIKFVCFASNNNSKQTTGGRLININWENSKLYNLPCNSKYTIKQFID
jgi:hypothetical protein